NVDAAGGGNGEVVTAVPLAVCVYVNRRKFAFVQNVIVGLVLIAVVFFVFFFLLPLLLDELEGDFFGNRMAGIVGSLHPNFCGVTLVIEIALRIGIGDGPAAGADERSGAPHLAPRSVGDLGLQTI